jgi:hypothetical protein
MPTSFPGTVDTYTVKVDNVSDVLAADINNLQDAVVAIQNRIGANASGAVITAIPAQTISGAKTFSGINTFSALNTFTNGRVQVSSAGTSAMWELNIVGVHARGWFLDSSGVTRLSVTNGSGVASTTYLEIDGSGNFTAAGNVTANSDERLKNNWRDLDADFLTRLAMLKMGVYDRTDTGQTQVGVSAQSLQAFLPQAVQAGDDGILSVAYGNAALAACVVLAREVVSLRRELNEMKGA